MSRAFKMSGGKFHGSKKEKSSSKGQKEEMSSLNEFRFLGGLAGFLHSDR